MCLCPQACVADLGFTETAIDQIVAGSRQALPDEETEKVSYIHMARSALAQGESMFGPACRTVIMRFAPYHIAMMAPLWITRLLGVHQDVMKMSLVSRLGRLSIVLSEFAKVWNCYWRSILCAKSLWMLMIYMNRA